MVYTELPLKERLRNIMYSHHGRNSAITQNELAVKTGYVEREVRKAIRVLITEGLPVLSTTTRPAGYYLPTSMDEVRTYAQHLRTLLIEDAKRRRDVLIAGDKYLKPAEQGKLM